MKKYAIISDWFFALSSAAFLVWAAADSKTFISITKANPYFMGFAKFFLLGTCGEVIKNYLKGGRGLDRPIQRAVVWGFFGVWISAAFPLFSAGTDALTTGGMWFEAMPAALSKSLWINCLGGFAFMMMTTHEYCNYVIKNDGRKWGLKGFAQSADPVFLLSFVPKTFLFWVPAHTFTFSLPPEWRALSAAVLAIALGFLLAGAKKAAK